MKSEDQRYHKNKNSKIKSNTISSNKIIINNSNSSKIGDNYNLLPIVIYILFLFLFQILGIRYRDIWDRVNKLGSVK